MAEAVSKVIDFNEDGSALDPEIKKVFDEARNLMPGAKDKTDREVQEALLKFKSRESSDLKLH